MIRACTACLLFVLGGAVVAEPLPVAPAPRAAPQVSLVVVENVTGPTGTVDTRRVLRVGVRNGKLLPAETVWEGDQSFLGHFGGHQLAGERYLVTAFGSIIDLHAKKVIHEERRGELRAIDGTKVIYHINNRREEGVRSFDLATGYLKWEPEPGARKYTLPGVVAPDRSASVESGPVADELFLRVPGEARKSLGKGFRVDIGPLSSTFGPAPVAWLNNGVFVTQKSNGKLVTVDVSGKVAELLTIKDAPKDLVSAPCFFRDGSNRLVYVCGQAAYLIDTEKKTWAKYEWRDLGHGFEASWDAVPKLGHKIRHNGKEIGQFNCLPYTAKAAPGYLAIEARVAQDSNESPDWVAVWCADAGEWQSLKLWPNCVVGWVK